ncbi:MAG: hypothetical protein A3E83_03560 [Gammaproteobacteria bacterium RIFCSPHIGHO2_12_FULL_41_20]|nr:MAG: hypothetical protein A3E83_03560 [Gammaproteobacteria bacterium RIFCSPHIGHO2_12_FULL_41_20]
MRDMRKKRLLIDFPGELQLEIIKYLPGSSLWAIPQVCRGLRQLQGDINKLQVWHQHDTKNCEKQRHYLRAWINREPVPKGFMLPATSEWLNCLEQIALHAQAKGDVELFLLALASKALVKIQENPPHAEAALQWLIVGGQVDEEWLSIILGRLAYAVGIETSLAEKTLQQILSMLQEADRDETAWSACGSLLPYFSDAQRQQVMREFLAELLDNDSVHQPTLWQQCNRMLPYCDAQQHIQVIERFLNLLKKPLISESAAVWQACWIIMPYLNTEQSAEVAQRIAVALSSCQNNYSLSIIISACRGVIPVLGEEQQACMLRRVLSCLSHTVESVRYAAYHTCLAIMPVVKVAQRQAIVDSFLQGLLGDNTHIAYNALQICAEMVPYLNLEQFNRMRSRVVFYLGVDDPIIGPVVRGACLGLAPKFTPTQCTLMMKRIGSWLEGKSGDLLQQQIALRIGNAMLPHLNAVDQKRVVDAVLRVLQEGHPRLREAAKGVLGSVWVYLNDMQRQQVWAHIDEIPEVFGQVCRAAQSQTLRLR